MMPLYFLSLPVCKQLLDTVEGELRLFLCVFSMSTEVSGHDKIERQFITCFCTCTSFGQVKLSLDKQSHNGTYSPTPDLDNFLQSRFVSVEMKTPCLLLIF